MGQVQQIHQRQFLHNMYFYDRMFNFEVYTLLQAMINCDASVLVHGRKDSGNEELLNSLFDAKTDAGPTLFIGTDSIKGLYPKRRIMEINDSWDGANLVSSPVFKEAEIAVVNGLTPLNIRLFLEMCKKGQGLASLEGHTLNFVLDEASELLGSDPKMETDIGAIDFVLTVEAHKLVSISEVIKGEDKYFLQPFAEFVGGNEYSFYSCISDGKINKMRKKNFEEAERFILSIKTYAATQE